jgi:hypothetical protein
MFRPLFGHPQAECTIIVIGSYYTHNFALYSIFITCIIRWDRLRGLVVRVPGYRTEMYCASCVKYKKVDRLCGLVVRVTGYRARGSGSIPGATKFSEK